MRWVAFAGLVGVWGLGLGLGACVTRDPSVAPITTAAGNWKIERQLDRITGAPLPSAQLITDTSSNSLDMQTRPASLQLTCFDNQPLVRFAFAFKVGTEGNTAFGYRFDDRPGHDNVNTRVLSNHTVMVIDNRAEVERFVSELRESRTLVVRIRSLSGPRTTAEFRLDGAPAAVEAAFAGCPGATAGDRTGGARS